MKKITAVLMIMAIMMTSMAMPEAFVSEFADEAITATAATDAWGREYLTYGDLRYQVQSDNTICIIGFDISKDTVEIPDEIDGMPVDDDTNYVVLAQIIIEKYGKNNKRGRSALPLAGQAGKDRSGPHKALQNTK